MSEERTAVESRVFVETNKLLKRSEAIQATQTGFKQHQGSYCNRGDGLKLFANLLFSKLIVYKLRDDKERRSYKQLRRPHSKLIIEGAGCGYINEKARAATFAPQKKEERWLICG